METPHAGFSVKACLHVQEPTLEQLIGPFQNMSPLVLEGTSPCQCFACAVFVEGESKGTEYQTGTFTL